MGNKSSALVIPRPPKPTNEAIIKANINNVRRQCTEVKVVEVSPNELQTVNDTLSISSSDACIADASRCKAGQITADCATDCQFIVPANLSTSSMKMYRIPPEIIPVDKQGLFPMSAAKKVFLEPSMPFEFKYNAEKFTIGKMVIYHPCPVRIENIQYDAVLQIGEVTAAGRSKRNDLVILIPLAGSNSPDEAGALLQKLTPFISGLADTGIGDTEATGGATLDKKGTTSYDQPGASRCDVVDDARWARWSTTMGTALNALKRRVIELARMDGKWFIHPGDPGGGGGQIINQYYRVGPPYLKEIVNASPKGTRALWDDFAYLFDVYEADTDGPWWETRYGDNWDEAKRLIDRIRAEKAKLEQKSQIRQQRKELEQEDKFNRLLEDGIPGPDETMTPCEILNVGVGQDWNLTKFMPVGNNGAVRVPYFTWKSAKVEYEPRSADATSCVMQYGLIPTMNYTRYIVLQTPTRISSADLRSIRSLPAVIPAESGVRFVATQRILYKNAMPSNCKDCKNNEGAKLSADLKKGKVDTRLLVSFLISILSSIAVVIAIYFGLRWAMGTKGELFKNLGVKVGSYVKISAPAPNAVNTALTQAVKAPATKLVAAPTKLAPLPADTKFTSIVPGS